MPPNSRKVSRATSAAIRRNADTDLEGVLPDASTVVLEASQQDSTNKPAKSKSVKSSRSKKQKRDEASEVRPVEEDVIDDITNCHDTEESISELAQDSPATNIDNMPVEVLASIVDYIVKTPIMAVRLTQLNRRMHFLIGGLPLWRDIGKKMKLPPPNPRATKFRTWLSVVGREGNRLCQWCFKRTQANDLLRFERENVPVKICGDCRAEKYELERNARFRSIQSRIAEMELDEMDGINSYEYEGAFDDYSDMDESFFLTGFGSINKTSAKEKYLLTDADLKKLECESVDNGFFKVVIYNLSAVLELARRKWGGDEGLAIRRDQASKARETREALKRAKDDLRRSQLRSYMCSTAVKRVQAIANAVSDFEGVPNFDAESEMTDREWRLIAKGSTHILELFTNSKVIAPGSEVTNPIRGGKTNDTGAESSEEEKEFQQRKTKKPVVRRGKKKDSTHDLGEEYPGVAEEGQVRFDDVPIVIPDASAAGPTTATFTQDTARKKKKTRSARGRSATALATLLAATIVELASGLLRLRLLSAAVESEGMQAGVTSDVPIVAAEHEIRSFVSGTRVSKPSPDEAAARNWIGEGHEDIVHSIDELQSIDDSYALRCAACIRDWSIGAVAKKVRMACDRLGMLITELSRVKRGLLTADGVENAVRGLAHPFLSSEISGEKEERKALEETVEKLILHKFVRGASLANCRRDPILNDIYLPRTTPAMNMDEKLETMLKDSIRTFVAKKIEKDDLTTPWKDDVREAWQTEENVHPPDFVEVHDKDVSETEVPAIMADFVEKILDIPVEDEGRDKSRSIFFSRCRVESDPVLQSSFLVPVTVWDRIDTEMTNQVLQRVEFRIVAAVRATWDESTLPTESEPVSPHLFTLTEVINLQPEAAPMTKIVDLLEQVKWDLRFPPLKSQDADVKGIAWYVKEHMTRSHSQGIPEGGESQGTGREPSVALEGSSLSEQIQTTWSKVCTRILDGKSLRIAECVVDPFIRDVVNEAGVRANVPEVIRSKWTRSAAYERLFELACYVTSSHLRERLSPSVKPKHRKQKTTNTDLLAVVGRLVDAPTHVREEAANTVKELEKDIKYLQNVLTHRSSSSAPVPSLESCVLALRESAEHVFRSVELPEHFRSMPKEVLDELFDRCLGEKALKIHGTCDVDGLMFNLTNMLRRGTMPPATYLEVTLNTIVKECVQSHAYWSTQFPVMSKGGHDSSSTSQALSLGTSGSTAADVDSNEMGSEGQDQEDDGDE
ncbi:hypothetical protein HDU93_003397 [Gonapodya sp. JEL0774]|nr:hypothetical protein HDU93_003397 [Gonapodya sp. JEL0774]